MKHRTSPMAWSPLGGGHLMQDQFREVFAVAPNYGATESQLALAWLLRHPSCVFPVVGTTRPDRIRECAKAVEIELDLQDWFEMLKAAMGREMP